MGSLVTPINGELYWPTLNPLAGSSIGFGGSNTAMGAASRRIPRKGEG
jgi:hypothetical protein